MTQGNKSIFLTLITIPLLFLHILLTSGHEAGEIDYRFFCKIRKVNQLILYLILFPLLVDTLPVKVTVIITIVAINTKFLLLLVTGHVGIF